MTAPDHYLAHDRQATLASVLAALWLALVPATVYSYRHLDRPIADWLDAVNAAAWPVLGWPHSVMDLILALLPLTLLLCLWQWWRRQHPPWLACAIDSCAALLLVLALKTPLKALFGRTWPATFYHDNPSYLEHGVYGFAPLMWQVAYWAFPSGHSAQICALALILAWHYPRARGVLALMSLAVMGDLVLLNYHWLSDVIGGALFGCTAALLVLALHLPRRLMPYRR